MSYLSKNIILIGTLISLGLIIYFTFYFKTSNNKINSKSNTIYRDISTDKIYNPEDIFPTVPGNYSRYLQPIPTLPVSLTKSFGYIINKNGMLLKSISNLPPNKVVYLSFDNLFIVIQTNNDGILYFNKDSTPLPIGIMTDINTIRIDFAVERINTISNYEGIPKYNNSSPYNMPIGNYVILNDTDMKNTYKLPYKIQILATGVCPPCLDSNKNTINNKTYTVTYELNIDGKKTIIDHIDGESQGHELCLKLCPYTPTPPS
jgi:hypothetical protein